MRELSRNAIYLVLPCATDDVSLPRFLENMYTHAPHVSYHKKIIIITNTAKKCCFIHILVGRRFIIYAMMMKTVHRRFTSVTAATWLRPLGGILAVLVLLSSQSASAHSANGVQHLRSRRHLQQSSLNITTTSIIPLFFSISYFDGTTSGGLESLDPNDEAVLALCKAVHEQVSDG